MKIVSFSFSIIEEDMEPEAWLKHIRFSSCALEGLTKYGEVIGVYHNQQQKQLQQNGVQYHFTNYKRWQLLLPFQFNLFIKKLKPDVVIVHGLISPWQVVILRWQLGGCVKIIVQHHAEPPLKDIRQYLQHWADRYIHAYLFCARELANPWIELAQIKDQGKIREVMEVSSLFSPTNKDVAKSITEISGQFNFLWVGRLLPIKNPLLVVQAFGRFVKLNPKAKLYMIYQSTELLKDVLKLINEMEAQTSIILVGKVEHDDLIQWYSSSDFIISSSLYEGSGTAICEAMSCGCIPILPSIPSFRMMTENGECGLLFTSQSSENLYTALTKSLTLNLPLESEKVLKQFNAKLSPESIAKKIYEVISSL